MITYTEDECGYTQAEREGLEWLAVQAKWLDVTVKRRSAREFDLGIEGQYDADTGYDYDMSKVVRTKTAKCETITGMRRFKRGYPEVQPQSFSAWFLLACLREFWSMNLISAPFGDWSFIRDREPETNWRVFEEVLRVQRLKQGMRPMFSPAFLAACRYVWQAVAEDSTEFADNEDAIECILDADRLTMVPGTGAAANDELNALDKRFGYEVVAAELSRVLRLV